MKPDRKHLGVRVQQWAIDIVHSVAREYQLTYGEALEKLIAAGKPPLLDMKGKRFYSCACTACSKARERIEHIVFPPPKEPTP